MEKTFNVEGIAKAMIIYRGGLLKCGNPFKVVMTENEMNRFRPFINDFRAEEITNEKEIVADTLKSEPIIETIEQKEEVIDVVQPKSNGRTNKNKHKNGV